MNRSDSSQLSKNRSGIVFKIYATMCMRRGADTYAICKSKVYMYIKLECFFRDIEKIFPKIDLGVFL